MGKITRNGLDSGEEIILSADVHWISMLPYVAIAIVAFIILVNLGVALSWMILIPLLIIGKQLIFLLSTDFILTNKRLIGKGGFINTRTLDSPINKLNNVVVESGLLGKIFDYGDVVVATSSSSYAFKNIAHPEVVRRSVMEQIEQHENDRMKRQAAEMANAMRGNNRDTELGHNEIREFVVAGVTFKNGRRHRQSILRQIYYRDEPYQNPTIRLERYEYEGEAAFAVYANDGQVGNISKSDIPYVLKHWNDYIGVSEFSVYGGGALDDGELCNYGMRINVKFAQ